MEALPHRAGLEHGKTNFAERSPGSTSFLPSTTLQQFQEILFVVEPSSRIGNRAAVDLPMPREAESKLRGEIHDPNPVCRKIPLLQVPR